MRPELRLLLLAVLPILLITHQLLELELRLELRLHPDL
jgi:hypothetical protein